MPIDNQLGDAQKLVELQKQALALEDKKRLIQSKTLKEIQASLQTEQELLEITKDVVEQEEKLEGFHAERVNALQAEKTAILESIANYEKERIEVETQLAAQEKIIIAQKEMKALKREQNETDEKYAERQAKAEEEHKKNQQLEQEKLFLLKKKKDDLRRVNLDELLTQKEKLNYQLREQEHLEKVNDITQKYLGLLGLEPSFEKSWLGKAEKTLKTVGIKGALSQIGESMKETLTVGNLLASTTEKVVESTIQLALRTDTAMAEFNKTTGAMGQYDQQMLKTGETNRAFNVDIEKSQEAFKAMFTNVSEFSMMTKEAQNETAGFTAKLSGMGIEVETSSQLYQTLTRGIGLTGKETEAMTRRLLANAEQLGIAPNEMLKSFTSVAPKLAAWGKDTEKVFTKLTATSKALGASVDELMGISEQFDTFEGAAEATGKLNAILGGDFLNSVEALNADESERIKLLQQSVQLSGKSWETLSKYERKAVAAAAGIKDMALAEKLFGQNAGDVNEILGKTGGIFDDKMMEEAAKASASMSQQFKLIIDSFAIVFEPVIKGIRFVLQGFAKLTDMTNGWFGAIAIGALAAMRYVPMIGSTIMKMLGPVGKGISSLFGSVGTAVKKLVPDIGKSIGKASEGVAKGVETVGKSAAKYGGSLLKLGAAFLMVGAGIGIAVFGLAQLAEAMKGMTGGEILGLVAILGVLVAAIFVLAVASTVAGPMVLLLGAAFLMLGGGIALAAIGLGSLVKSLSEVSGNADQIASLAGSLVLVAGSFAAIAAAGMLMTLAVPGLLLFAGSLLTMAAGLALIKTDDLQALATMFTAFPAAAASIDALASGLTTLKGVLSGFVDSAEGLLAVGNALNALPAEKTLSIAASMDTFQRTMVEAQRLTPEAIDNTSKLVETAERYSVVHKEMTTTNVVDSFVETIKSAVGLGGKEAGGSKAGSAVAVTGAGEKGSDIVLVLNERELGRAVEAVLNKKHNLRIGT